MNSFFLAGVHATAVGNTGEGDRTENAVYLIFGIADGGQKRIRIFGERQVISRSGHVTCYPIVVYVRSITTKR